MQSQLALGQSRAVFHASRRRTLQQQGAECIRCNAAVPHKPRLSYVGQRVSPAIPRLAWAGEGNLTQIHRKASEGQLRSPLITKSDESFRADDLEFVWGMQDLNLEELSSLFSKVKFPTRDAGKLKTALERSYAVIWVRSTRNSRWAKVGQLLGFARAFSDEALTATIWDVAVHPAWQRGGLGRALMERLTAFLVEADIQTICLYAEPNVVALYEKLGFEKDPFGVKGMAFQPDSKAGKVLLAAA